MKTDRLSILINRTFSSGSEQDETYYICVYSSKSDVKSGKAQRIAEITKSIFETQLVSKPNVRVEVPGSHGTHITLTYTIISTPSLYYYLSESDTRDKALKDIVTLAQADQLLKQLSSPELATLLVKMLFNYVKQRKMSDTLSELINSAWLAIISKIRFLGRIAELFPNLDTYIWKQLHKDDGKNDARYALPFMILKTLTTLPGGENTLPTVVAEFTRIANALHSNPDASTNTLKALPFIAQLVAFYDHKYVPFIVKKTDFLESCYKILVFAKNHAILLDEPKPVESTKSKKKGDKAADGDSGASLEIGHKILDPILSLIRFLGSEYRQTMIDKEIFEPIKTISSSGSDSKSQMAALKVLEQFNIELSATESTAGILADSASKETNPYLKHKAMQMVTDSIRTGADKFDETTKLKVTSTAFNSLDCDFAPTAKLATEILEKLNPSIEILIEVGLLESLVSLFKRLKQSSKPGTDIEARLPHLQYVSGKLIDAITSQCVETEKVAGSHTPPVFKHTGLSIPSLRAKILEVNLYGVMADIAPLFWQYTGLLSYLPFWLALGRIEPSFAEPSRLLFESFLDYLETLYGTTEAYSMSPVKPDVILLVAFHLLDEVVVEAEARVRKLKAEKSLVDDPAASIEEQCKVRETVAQALYENDALPAYWTRLNNFLKDKYVQHLLESDQSKQHVFMLPHYLKRAQEYEGAGLTPAQGMAIRSMLPLQSQSRLCEHIISLLNVPDAHAIYTATLLVRSFVRTSLPHQLLFGLLHDISRLPPAFFWIRYKKFMPILSVEEHFGMGPVNANAFAREQYRSHPADSIAVTPPAKLYSPYALSHFLNYVLHAFHSWLDLSWMASSAGLQKRLDISEFLTAYVRHSLVVSKDAASSTSTSLADASAAAIAKAFSSSGEVYTLDNTRLTRTLFNVACDYIYLLLQGKGGPLADKARQAGERAVWFTDPVFLSFLMSSSTTHPRIVSMIASVSSLGLDAVCQEIYAQRAATTQSSTNSSAPAPSGPNNKSAALTKCLELLKQVMSSPASRLNALEAAAEGLLSNTNMPAATLISDFGRQLAALWPSIREYYVNKRAMSGKLTWPWRLSVLANFALVFSDVNWYYTQRYFSQQLSSIASDYSNSFLVSHMLTFGTIEENYFTPMMETFKAHQFDRRYFQYAFSSPNAGQALPRVMQRPSSYPTWNWFDRMETFRSLQTVIIDCLNLIPMDKLLPLAVEGEHVDTEELARLKFTGWPEVEEWNHPPKEGESHPTLPPSHFAMQAVANHGRGVGVHGDAHLWELYIRKVNLCYLTAAFVTEILYYAFMPAAGYPCPSISKPALNWMIDHFWSRLPHEKEDSKNLLLARELSMLVTSSATHPQVGERPVTPLHFFFLARYNLPKSIHGYYLVHANDPAMMLKFWKLIADRLTVNEHNAALLHPIEDSTIQTVANGFITRYMEQLAWFVKDPENWERKMVTKMQAMKTPVLLTNVFRFSEDVTNNSSPFITYELPNPTQGSSTKSKTSKMHITPKVEAVYEPEEEVAKPSSSTLIKSRYKKPSPVVRPNVRIMPHPSSKVEMKRPSSRNTEVEAFIPKRREKSVVQPRRPRAVSASSSQSDSAEPSTSSEASGSDPSTFTHESTGSNSDVSDVEIDDYEEEASLDAPIAPPHPSTLKPSGELGSGVEADKSRATLDGEEKFIGSAVDDLRRPDILSSSSPSDAISSATMSSSSPTSTKDSGSSKAPLSAATSTFDSSQSSDDPHRQRYLNTGVWSDCDELDWFCAPVQVRLCPGKTRRYSPLDTDVFSAREYAAMLPKGEYIETRPFVGVTIPEGATAEQKAEIYFKALSEPLLEAVRYLCSTAAVGSHTSAFPGFLCNRWSMPSVEAWPAAIASHSVFNSPSNNVGHLRRFLAFPYTLYGPTLIFKHITDWFIKEEQEKARDASKTPASLNLPSAISLAPSAKDQHPKYKETKTLPRRRYSISASTESLSESESSDISDVSGISSDSEAYVVTKMMRRSSLKVIDISSKTSKSETPKDELDALLIGQEVEKKEEEVEAEPIVEKIEEAPAKTDETDESNGSQLDVFSSPGAIDFAWKVLHQLRTLRSLPMSVQTGGGNLLKKLLDIEAQNGEPRLLVQDPFFSSTVLPTLAAFAQFMPSMPSFKPVGEIYGAASSALSSATQSSASTTDGEKEGEHRVKPKKKSAKADSSATSALDDTPEESLTEMEKRVRIMVDRITQELHDAVDELRTYRKIDRERIPAPAPTRGFLAHLALFNDQVALYKNFQRVYDAVRSRLGSLIQLQCAFPNAFQVRRLLFPKDIIAYASDTSFNIAVRQAELSHDDENASVLQRLALLDFGDGISPIATFNRPGLCYTEEQLTHAQLHVLVAQLINHKTIRLLLSDPIWHAQLSLHTGQMVSVRSILPFRAIGLLAKDGFFEEFASEGFGHRTAAADHSDKLTFNQYRSAIARALHDTQLHPTSRGLAHDGWIAMLTNDPSAHGMSTTNYAAMSDVFQGFALDAFNDGAGILRFTTTAAYASNWHIVRPWVEFNNSPALSEFGAQGEPIVDAKRGHKTIPRFVVRTSPGAVQVSTNPVLFVGTPPEFTAHHSVVGTANTLKAVWQNFSGQSHVQGSAATWETPLSILAMRIYTGRAKDGDYLGTKEEALKLANSLDPAFKLYSNTYLGTNAISLTSYNPDRAFQSSGGPVWINYAPAIKDAWIAVNSHLIDNKGAANEESSKPPKPVALGIIPSEYFASSSSASPPPPPPIPIGGIKKAISYLDSVKPKVVFDGINYTGMLPYNRIVNVMHEPYGTSQCAGHILRLDFQRKSIFGNGDTAAQRFGFATRAAMEEINKHPLLQVGDVPGSFAYAAREHALYSQGRFISLTSHGLPTPVSVNFCTIMYDPASHIIYFAGPIEILGSHSTMTEHSVALRVPSDITDELFPTISAASILKYTLVRASEPAPPPGCTYLNA